MTEYLEQIEKEEQDKPLKLYNIIKKEERTIFKIIDIIFLILILSGLAWGWTHGAYQKTNIIVDCQGDIMSINNEINYGNLTLKDYGLTKTNTKEEQENGTTK